MEVLGTVSVAVAVLLPAGFLYVRRRSGAGTPKSAGRKRSEIVESYKRRMDTELGPLRHDPEALRRKQVELLRAFSIEISSNVFFGPGEVRKVIGELAGYEPEKR